MAMDLAEGRAACAATIHATRVALRLGPALNGLPTGLAAITSWVAVDWRSSPATVAERAGPDGALLVMNHPAWPRPKAGRYDYVVVTDFDRDVHPLAFLDALDDALSTQGSAWLRARSPGYDWSVLATVARRAGWVVPDTPERGEWLVMSRREPPPRWRVRHARPDDYPEIAALFELVFGYPLPESLWQWKYGDGRGNAVLARRDGQLVAHYGGMYRDVLVAGQRERVAQIGDVMVHAQERGVLTRQGPFALVGMTWPEVYGPKGFGFPTDRALRVAEKLGIYVQAGHMAELIWPARPLGPRWNTRIRDLDGDDPANPPIIDGLWRAMQQDFADGALGVRDWAYVRHRYLEHPTHRYQLVLVQSRWRARPLALLVFRRHADYLEWLDIVGSMAHLPACVEQAQRLAARWGLPVLRFWCTVQHAPRFQTMGATVQPLDLAIPASCWPDPENPKRYVGKWWLTAGDTDFR